MPIFVTALHSVQQITRPAYARQTQYPQAMGAMGDVSIALQASNTMRQAVAASLARWAIRAMARVVRTFTAWLTRDCSIPPLNQALAFYHRLRQRD